MNNNAFKLHLFITNLLLAGFLSACATTSSQPAAGEDWEAFNRTMQTFNDDLDSWVVKPVAEAYLWSTPEVVDTGVTNFFNNIEDVGVTLNDFLQLKWRDGGSDFTRFLVNSTVGIAGIMDVGSLLDLPKHDEDFDQTLGVWGVPMTPYLVLPFIAQALQEVC